MSILRRHKVALKTGFQISAGWLRATERVALYVRVTGSDWPEYSNVMYKQKLNQWKQVIIINCLK